MRATLSLATFKPIESPEVGYSFFQTLEEVGGIYVPEIIGDRIKYVRGSKQLVERYWKAGPLLLRRRTPPEVNIAITLSSEKMLKVVPNTVYISVDLSHFHSPDDLEELVELGKGIYDVYSPCYEFIALPWMPELQVMGDPESGLPGLGWATWLGPEYKDLVNISESSPIRLEKMADQGRLFVFLSPEDPRKPDEVCLHAYEFLRGHIDDEVFKPTNERFHDLSQFERQEALGEAAKIISNLAKSGKSKKRASRVPKFHFRDEAYTNKLSGRQAEVIEVGSRRSVKTPRTRPFGPKGFTRAEPVRVILEKHETVRTHRATNDSASGLVSFEGLTAEEAKQLLQVLPKE